MSQLDDFIAKPMGEGLDDKDGPGQSVHPQAPEEHSKLPGQTPARGTPVSEGRPPIDPHKQASGERLGSEIAAARVDLGDGELRQPDVSPGVGDVGGANAGGLSASLGLRDPTPKSFAPAADPDRDAANEQEDALEAHAAAQSGEPERAAPDQTRAEGTYGSINETTGH